MSLSKRLQKENDVVSNKTKNEREEKKSPIVELKEKIKVKVIEELTIDYKKIDEDNELRKEIEDIILNVKSF